MSQGISPIDHKEFDSPFKNTSTSLSICFYFNLANIFSTTGCLTLMKMPLVLGSLHADINSFNTLTFCCAYLFIYLLAEPGVVGGA